MPIHVDDPKLGPGAEAAARACFQQAPEKPDGVIVIYTKNIGPREGRTGVGTASRGPMSDERAAEILRWGAQVVGAETMKCPRCGGPAVRVDGTTCEPVEGVLASALCFNCFIDRPFNVQDCAKCGRKNVLCRMYLGGVRCDDCKAKEKQPS
jgi:hypothetical protein